jgi:serine/threonine protein kinase/Flp pilus assembly protein TadD
MDDGARVASPSVVRSERTVNVRPEDWPRIKEIFNHAVSMAPAERAPYIAQACQDDAVMRRYVEQLLDSHDSAPEFLEPVTAASDLTPDSLVGRTVGTYRLLGRIGAGGMGEVYEAHDTKLDRHVALKLLSPRFVRDPERLRRFSAEARAASSLNHPHILIIHDFGEMDGRPFMVSELVEGETLRQQLQRGPVALPRAVDIALQVVNALASAHTRGIIHRDIKPENIMVRPDGYVKILDFGIAKLIVPDQADAVNAASATIPGTMIGTPRYMSPEQVRGMELDERSDVWSTGVLLYEMITGRPPFSGATPFDLIGAVLSSDPVPIELQAPRVPVGLQRVVAKALRKDRLERYASATELAADLSAIKRLLDWQEPTESGEAAAALDSEQRSPTPSGHVAKRTRIIVIPFRLLRPDPEIDFLGFSLADAMATTLSGLDSVIVRSSLAATRFADEAVDVKAIAAAAEVDAILTGSLLRMGTNVRVNAQVVAAPQGTIVWSDKLDASVDDVFRLQDELSRRVVDALAVPLTVRDQEILQRDVPASAKGYELYLRANVHFYHPENWTIARDLLIECVKEDPQYAPAWARLGRCYRLTAKFKSETVQEITENLRRADVAFRKAFDLNPDLPAAHHLYTALETDLGRAEDALVRLVRRARQRRGDPELFAGLVHACRYCGLLDESVAAHERAKQLDPQISTSVALSYWARGEYERANESFTGFFAGLPLVSMGRYAEAIAAARASAAVVRDPTTRSYQSIFTLMLEGRTPECLRLLDELAPRNPDPESVFHIARTYARLGASDRAVSTFERAVSMGFFCYPLFSQDEWLDPLRALPAFIDAITRAKQRHEEAARLFRDAHGARLLGLAE